MICLVSRSQVWQALLALLDLLPAVLVVAQLTATYTILASQTLQRQ
jgi:hypothetical protein